MKCVIAHRKTMAWQKIKMKKHPRLSIWRVDETEETA